MQARTDADVGTLTPERALELTRAGGTVLCLGVPKGVEFGIDLRSYAVGPTFRGVKMVPPRGLHFVSCGNELEHSGVFVRLLSSATCAFNWDAQNETLCLEADLEQQERLAASVRQMEHDAFLGPYPIATEPEWTQLSCYITEKVLSRAGVPLGTFVMPGGIDDEDDSKDGLQPVQPYFAGTARVARFVQLNPKRSERGQGRTGADLSRFHLDKSEWLAELLRHEFGAQSEQGNGGGSSAAADAEAALLGELQLAFLLFLRLSSLRALEQWKAAIHLLCHCEAALLERPALYERLLPALRAQLTLAPRDFFEDALSEDNFLRGSLASLAELADGQPLAPALQHELAELWRFLAVHFGVTVEALRAASMEDDDEPVVVET